MAAPQSADGDVVLPWHLNTALVNAPLNITPQKVKPLGVTQPVLRH